MRRRTMVRVLGLAAWVYGALVIGSPAAEEQLGKVHFSVSCSPAAQAQFDRAMALLHSFFYPETVKAFTAITQTEPGCAMAYWGLAMSIRQNPLIPVNIATLKQGGEAIEKAKATSAATPRERDWIAALDTYYRDLDTVDHKTRVLAYEKGMEYLSLRYPDDSEATIFYALALNEATELADKTYARQLKAGALLEQVFAQQPDHPGVAHYIIHSYDYGPLAVRALPAARHYAAIAPSASHALHMPSHIFSMLGLWHDVVTSNRAAEAATKAYAAKHLTGETRWLHAQDFRIHAHLQLAQDQQARRIVDERHTIEKPLPVRLPTKTAFAAIPVRYAMAHGGMGRMAATIALPFVRVQDRAEAWDMLGNQVVAGPLVRVIANPETRFARPSRDHADHGGTIVRIGAVPSPLIGPPPGWVSGIRMGRACFPPRSDRARRLRRRCQA